MGNTISRKKRARQALSISAAAKAAPNENSGNTPARFSLLPRELRDEILSYLIYHAQWAPTDRHYHGFGPDSIGIDANWVYSIYKLVLVSKQFQSEVLDALPHRLVARGFVTLHRYLQVLASIRGLSRVEEVNVYVDSLRLYVEKDHVVKSKDPLERCKHARLFVTCLGETYPDSNKSLTRYSLLDMIRSDSKKSVMSLIADLVDSTWGDQHLGMNESRLEMAQEGVSGCSKVPVSRQLFSVLTLTRSGG
jgi:hypothetical protein